MDSIVPVGNKYAIYSSAVEESSAPIDVYDTKRNGRLVVQADMQEEVTRQVMLGAEDWLPFASESYKISPKIEDYVLLPLPIIWTGLPNKNGIYFSFNELTKWSPSAGRVAYQSWIGKPTHIEHQNSVHEDAKGVIFSSVLRRMTNVQGNIWKVVLLLGFCRQKDPLLANDILGRKRTCGSMGAYASHYVCSICGKRHPDPGCEHVQLGKPKFNLVNGKLAALGAVNPDGFECSSVAQPAYVQCVNPKGGWLPFGK